MDILRKHKKKGEDGFKEFVQFLESVGLQKKNDIIEIAYLEDPVYTTWIMKNLKGFKFFYDLEEEEIAKVFDQIPNAVDIFIIAFYQTEDLKIIESKLSDKIKSAMKDEIDRFAQIDPRERSSARKMIQENMFNLQNSRQIKPYEWRLPSQKIMNGEYFIIPSNGDFALYFEDGMTALKGQYDHKLRAGIWKHFYPNTFLFAQGIYSEGEKKGPWKFFYPMGSLKAEGEYRENLRQGKWTHYDQQGSETIVYYERGKVITP